MPISFKPVLVARSICYGVRLELPVPGYWHNDFFCVVVAYQCHTARNCQDFVAALGALIFEKIDVGLVDHAFSAFVIAVGPSNQTPALLTRISSRP